MVKFWTGQRLKDLLSLSVDELTTKYPNITRGAARQAKYSAKQKLRRIDLMPEKEKLSRYEEDQMIKDNLDKIAELLDKSGIKPEEIQSIDKVRVGSYQMLTKDNEGEAHIHDLDVINLTYTPKVEFDEKIFLTQAPPTIIRPTKANRTKNRDKQAIILPDIQAGFRLYEDGELDPMHDTKAIDVALQIIKDVQPDLVALNGDNLDLPQFGRFSQENTFANTLNPTLEYVHNLLATIRSNAPNAKVVYLAGNHELRLSKYLMQYAREIHGVKQAETAEKVLTIPFLLNLAGIDVDYLSGYPANKYWINERLKMIHGHIVRAAGQTAGAVVRNENTSTLFGHIHRHEYAARTISAFNTARYIIAQSFGCLARVDGAVASYGSGIDEVTDRPIENMENWQQGLGYVEYREGDSPFNTQQITINTFDGYTTNFGNKTYRPLEAKVEQKSRK